MEQHTILCGLVLNVLFFVAAEFCSESPLWRLHAAHVLFMRGDKYKEAAAFYEPIVRQNYGDILSVSAAVLGDHLLNLNILLNVFV